MSCLPDPARVGGGRQGSPTPSLRRLATCTVGGRLQLPPVAGMVHWHPRTARPRAKRSGGTASALASARLGPGARLWRGNIRPLSRPLQVGEALRRCPIEGDAGPQVAGGLGEQPLASRLGG